MKLPFNTIPVLGEDGKELDDTGKRVVVNSIGGGLKNARGKVVFGPHIYWYKALTKKKKRSKKEKQKMAPGEWKTQPSWMVLLDGYMAEMTFVAQELTFLE